ncbi:MAG: c-type cytochrome [Acidobacteria bacterium]|nr:c-type cytochrome [Acidobacteriota bacterium]
MRRDVATFGIFRAVGILAIAGLAAGAARADQGEPPTSGAGERYFYNRTVGPGKVACADCHTIEDPAKGAMDDLVRAGHSLFDAFARGSWWNGHVTTDSGEAAEVCHHRFQGGEEIDSRSRTSLVMLMKDHSTPVSSPITVLRVPPGRTPVNSGDAARGKDLFRRACAVCHEATGPNGGGSLAASSKTPREIADVVRTGQGRMPLFQGDVLSDDQVADIAAYAFSLQPPAKQP